MSTLHPTELERRAEEHYRRVYGTSPDQDAIVDHGSRVLREHLLTEMRERMENARREVKARHRRESELAQAKLAGQAAHDTAAAEAHEAGLRERFQRQLPGASEADFAAARPGLLAQIAEERREADRDALATAKRRIRI